MPEDQPPRGAGNARRNVLAAAHLARTSEAVPGPDFVVDPFDRIIIAALQKNARVSNAELARRLGVGEATIRRRIERLLSSGAIQVVAVPNPDLFGHTLKVLIGISCEPRNLKAAADALLELPETHYLAYSTGSFDLYLEAWLRSHDHLIEFLTEKLSEVPGVARVETSIMLHVLRFGFEWEVPLDSAPIPGPRR